MITEQTSEPLWAGPRMDIPLEIETLRTNRGDSIVLAMGALRPQLASYVPGAEKLAMRVNQASFSSRIVYVCFACSGGYMSGLREAERELRSAAKRSAIVGFVNVACGPAFYLAQIIRSVGLLFASPSGHLGMVGASEHGTTTNVEIVRNLQRLNPDVHLNTWFPLAAGYYRNGEQCEAAGIVGGLRRDVFELAGVEVRAMQ